MDFLNPWYRFATRFEITVSDFFDNLGHNVAKHPYRHISGVIVVVIACALGFSKLHLVSEGEKIWVPQDSEALRDTNYIQNSYAASFRGGSVLYLSTDAVDNDLLNLEAFEVLWDVHEAIASQTEANGLKWDDLCGMRHNDGSCFSVGPLEMWKFNKTYYDETVQTRSDLITALSSARYPNGAIVNRDLVFGKFTVNETDNALASCEGMLQYYYISGSSLSIGMTFETSFISTLDAAPQSELTKFFFFSNRSMSDELENAIGGDVGLMVVTYMLMIGFTCFVLAKNRTLVGTRTALGCSGVGIVVLAIIAGYGLCAGMGILFTSIHQVLPFIIVGVGVDDMFIIVAAFDAQDERLPVGDRLGWALRRCGFSISYTTATDVIAFFLGASSTLPAIQSFCLYAGVSMLFNFCFQVTMFCALLCLDAERSRLNKADCLCCVTLSGSSTDKPPTSSQAHMQVAAEELIGAGAGAAPTAGGGGGFAIDDAAIPPTSPCINAAVEPESESPLPGSPGYVGSPSRHGLLQQPQPQQQQQQQQHPASNNGYSVPATEALTNIQYFFGEVYWPLLKRPWFRGCIIILFAAVSGLFIYGTTQLTQGFDMIDLVSDQSYARAYITHARELDLYVIDNNSPVMLVYKDISYHLQESQMEMLRLQEDFLEGSHSKGPFSSWVTDFTLWVGSDLSPYNNSLNTAGFLTNETLFYKAVDDFLTVPQFTHFASDVVRSGSGSSCCVVTSRVTAYLRDVGSPLKKIDAMDYTRSLMDTSSLVPKPFAFSFTFVFTETETIIGSEMKLNLALALCAVVLVSVFVLIQPKAVLLIAVLVAVIDADLLGGMNYWGLQVNTVTVVQLVMAVGLVVDYVAHILHCYMQQPTDIPDMERLRDALIEIGPSVLMGALTTFIGIMPLLFANSAIFRTFFKMFFLIIVFGAAHGLILLPAIITLIAFDDISGFRAEAERGSAHGNKAIKQSEHGGADEDALGGEDKARGHPAGSGGFELVAANPPADEVSAL